MAARFSRMILTAVAAATLFTASAQAQQYPDRVVKMQVGFPAGGGADIIARWYSDKLAKALNGTFIVENRVGASGNLALDATAKAKPDGYTLMFASTVTTAGNASLFKDLPMDVRKDIVPIVGFGETPTLIALFLYGLLPIFENALTGLTRLPPEVVDAANGMGMTETQRLLKVEAPLALPVILEGVRLSAVIALATAAIGSTVAAKGLGEVIIAGLQSNNLAFVVQGGVVVALLAVVLYEALSGLERVLARRAGLIAEAQGA